MAITSESPPNACSRDPVRAAHRRDDPDRVPYFSKEGKFHPKRLSDAAAHRDSPLLAFHLIKQHRGSLGEAFLSITASIQPLDW